jgi:hypothetical protein
MRPYLVEQGFLPIRFSGVDASKGDHLEYLDHITPVCQSTCPKGVMGIGLSHILLAQKLWDQGTEVALVLEDDAYPKVEDLQSEIEKTILEVPDDWSIIKLHCDYCHEGHTNSGAGGSLAAYVINRKGMDFMRNLKLAWHLDVQIRFEPTVYKSRENLFWTDEHQSENRESVSTPLGKFLDNFIPNSGEKTIDHLLSFKVFRVPGTTFEVTGWHLLGVIFLVFVFNK